MILIRGIKGDAYARRIEKGIVDCRDILSALLEPPVTGYEYSDYYEKNLVKALAYFGNSDSVRLHDPMFLYSLLIDYYVPHIYLSYFHILNERSVEWLEKFDDDYSFIAITPKIDRITNAVIGKEYFGTKMAYVDDIRNVMQNEHSGFRAACLCSIQNLFPNLLDSNIPLQVYNTLCFPLLHREEDGKFTNIENEFRIIAFDCPRINGANRTQIPREITLKGKSGCEYHGTLLAGQNTCLESNLRVFRKPAKPLNEILIEEKGLVSIDSKFKAINIRSISDKYSYIGNKDDCLNFIKETLANPPPDVYVDRTKRKTYDITTLENAVVFPGYQEVNY